jgi:hypothetical protein
MSYARLTALRRLISHAVTKPRSRRRLTARVAGLLLVSLALSAVAGIAAGDILTPNPQRLKAFGPVSESNGFPVWYKDSGDDKLELCLDAGNANCGFLPGDVPDETKPLSFPGNWPGEIFYFLAGSTIDIPGGGRLVATLGLESAFANGAPRAGDQVVFGRIRFTGRGMPPDTTFTITHPYGKDTVTSDADGAVKFVEDVGVAPGQFGAALNSRVSTFLKWDATAPQAPAGYVGDPNVEHAITGSPLNTNYFAVTGGGLDLRNDLFTVHGKYATNGGVEPTRATYSRSATDGGTLDVFATSDIGNRTLEVSGAGFFPTRLTGGQGRYAARLDYKGAVPAKVTVSAVSDTPVSTKAITVTDAVTGDATWNADTATLTVHGASSDKGDPPVLTAEGFGPITAAAFTNVAAPPASVTITSSHGGSVSVPATVTGASYPPLPVSAFAGVDQLALSGRTVTLDASGSTGPIDTYAWRQLDGPAVGLSSTTTKSVTFTAPAVPAGQTAATLRFELTVTGVGGPKTSTVTVKVSASAPAVVAKAGPDQANVDQTAAVTLDGSLSENATKLEWKQTAGTPVTLTGATTAKPTFTAPKTAETFRFTLTATGVDGRTSTDDVNVTTKPDVLTAPTVEYRTSKGEWRIIGTSSVAGPGVTVTIYRGTTATAANQVGTPAPVDTLKAWQYRAAGPAPLAGNRILLKSSAGGTLVVAVTVRN